MDKNGLHSSPEKAKAIAKAPTPTNVTELKSVLGLRNYYITFLRNLSMFLSIPGSNMDHADGLIHLPLPHKPSSVPEPGDQILVTNHLFECIITANHIKAWTDKDPVLSHVRRLVQVGWTLSDPGPDFIPYFNHHCEFSVLDGCVLWGSCVVIPPTGHDFILSQLHEARPEVSRMKRLACCFLWGPGLDSAIENRVHSCEKCQTNRPLPPKAPLHSGKTLVEPGHVYTLIMLVHSYIGHTFLIVVDVHSKWIESHVLNSTSSEATIKVLRNLFATHGIPQHVVSDNGSGFTSQEFKQFMEHTTISLYHPSSNKLAERAVQTVKHGISKLEVTIECRLARFLFNYCVTPQSTTVITCRTVGGN